MSGTAGKEYQLALCKALLHAVLGIQLGKCAACKWSVDLSLHSGISAKVRYIDAVHNGCKHSDLVCLAAVDGLAGTSSPEVSTADHDSNLYAFVRNCLDLLGYSQNCCLVKSCLFLPGESFPAEL